MDNPSANQAKISFKQKGLIVKNVLFRFMPLLIKVIPGMTLLLMACKLVSSLIPVAQLYLVKETIDEITEVFGQQTRSLSFVFMLLGMQGVLLLLDKLVQFVEQLVGYRSQQHLKYHFEMLLLQKSAKLPLRYFDRPDYFDQLERAALGMDIKGFNIFVLFMNMVRNCISLIGMVYILISFHWVLALAVSIMIVPNLWVSAFFGQRKYMQMILHTPAQRKTHYLLQLLHSRNAAKEVRVYQNAPYLIAKWQRLFWKTTDERYQLEKTAGWRSLIVDASHSLLNIGTFGLLVWLGYQGSLTVGHYVSLTQALVQIEGIISGLGRNIAGIYEESLFVNEVLTYLELETEEPGENHIKFPEPLRDGIEVSDLAFAYTDQSPPVLKGVSLRIRPGEKIAIVGENGAGKSTLVKCLLGLYSPDRGTIRFDGIDLRDMDQNSMRSNISAVFQDFMSYQLTARENIAMGQVSKVKDDGAIREAADKAGAGELLRRLPQDMDTELGSLFDHGYELSGGQWQKIALSRAFLKDAQIVILDEPTASLDPKAEAEVYDNFTRLYEGKTTIMISHRLSSCRHADRIIVLRDGRIIEEGSHEELIRREGEYAQMFTSQAQRYTA